MFNYQPSIPNMRDIFPKIEPIKPPEIENPIGDTLEEMSKSTKSIADSAKIQADVALKTSKKADVKGWISVIIAFICAVMEFAVHHNEIIDFFRSISAK